MRNVSVVFALCIGSLFGAGSYVLSDGSILIGTSVGLAVGSVFSGLFYSLDQIEELKAKMSSDGLIDE